MSLITPERTSLEPGLSAWQLSSLNGEGIREGILITGFPISGLYPDLSELFSELGDNLRLF